MKIEIVRNITKSICLFKEHFKNFEHTQAVQKIFGDKTHHVLDNLEVEFNNSTIYMSVDYDGRLLVNPAYLANGDHTDLYLDIIHELVHVQQVIDGENFNHEVPYVERPLEIEAYQTAVNEARSLGWDETRIIRYLDSDLINAEELRKLASTLEIVEAEETLSDDIN